MIIYINIHGINISIQSECDTIIQWIKFDFAHFITKHSSHIYDVILTIIEAPPPPLPPYPAIKHTGSYVIFKNESSRVIEYPGGIQVIDKDGAEEATFYGTDLELLYEKSYLYIQSRIGELLDTRGLHRIHGLGFSVDNKAYLYLMPMGGGKSTLALKLSKDKSISLFSDDTPIVDERGNMIPCPLRLGVIKGEEPRDIPPDLIRTFARQTRIHKTLIHPDVIKNWAKNPTKISVVLCGRWTGAAVPSIEKISKFKLFNFLVRDCVLGVGLPQVVEFFIKGGLRDLISKSWIAFRRLIAVIKICIHADGYDIQMTKDQDANVKLVSTLF